MILNIIIIVFVVGCMLIGLKRGFTDTVIRLAGGIIAIILAFVLQSSVANFITDKTGFDKQISQSLRTNITKVLTKEDKTSIIERDNNEMFLGMPNILSQRYEEIRNSSGKVRDSKVNEWSNAIAKFIIMGISFIAIFITVSILIGIARLILGGIADLPVLKELDGLAGLGAGFILAIIDLMIVFSIISFISPMQMMAGLNRLIEGSTIAKFISDNNFILTIITNKFL